MEKDQDSTKIPKAQFEAELLEAVEAAGHVVAGIFLGCSSRIDYTHHPSPETMSVMVWYPGVFRNAAETISEFVAKGERQRAIHLCRWYGLLAMSGDATRQRFGPRDEDWARWEQEFWESELDPELKRALTGEINWNPVIPELQFRVGQCLCLTRCVYPKKGVFVTAKALNLFFEQCRIADQFFAEPLVWTCVTRLSRSILRKDIRRYASPDGVIGMAAWDYLQRLRASETWRKLLRLARFTESRPTIHCG